MKKISILLFVATLFLFSANTVFAHTHLDSSNPEDGTTVTESIDTIELNFDTVIEQNATLQVESSEGDTFEVTDISITDGELVATLDEDLANGSYTVTWDIIGVDGHAMQDSITFEVDAESSEEEEIEESTTAEENESMTENNQSESDDSTTADETNEETATDSSSNTMIIAILLVAIIAIIAIVLIRKKK
ncbi:copper resistance protein CopC [Oceanobacillus sp. 1P07AA]|uniref:copper resistance CopC family protein n=1 Tax=Oceanobacillus sp. 1P07AA TaxID=3132293 RepID=UPI0039A71AE8